MRKKNAEKGCKRRHEVSALQLGFWPLHGGGGPAPHTQLSTQHLSFSCCA